MKRKGLISQGRKDVATPLVEAMSENCERVNDMTSVLGWRNSSHATLFESHQFQATVGVRSYSISDKACGPTRVRS